MRVERTHLIKDLREQVLSCDNVLYFWDFWAAVDRTRQLVPSGFAKETLILIQVIIPTELLSDDLLLFCICVYVLFCFFLFIVCFSLESFSRKAMPSLLNVGNYNHIFQKKLLEEHSDVPKNLALKFTKTSWELGLSWVLLLGVGLTTFCCHQVSAFLILHKELIFRQTLRDRDSW